MNFTLQEVAYIGDDIGDMELLKKVGYSAAPNNAVDYIKQKVNFVTSKRGGDGAFREFVESIIGINNIMELLESKNK